MTQDAAESPDFSREAPASGVMSEVAPGVRRLVCPNPSPFTQTGTCTYVVGRGRVAVIDPGPDHEGHVAALVAALAGETVEAILVTHTHRDHSPGARRLKALTGAPIVGCGPHRRARALGPAEINPLDAAGDTEHAPDRVLHEGEAAQGPGWTLVALETPGHTMNHLAFAHPEQNILFSGDHVMAWSTTIVAPPDGSMAAYMASLDKLRGRTEATYFPGHGGPVREPVRFVRALGHHRRQREGAILARVAGGDRAIPAIVAAVYQGLNPALAGAAGLSVFAHLESLIARGLVVTDGPPTLASEYRPA
jgi:glyoxylase-like metal-dependent hydrolase (beta-lactamase superfamily II)